MPMQPYAFEKVEQKERIDGSISIFFTLQNCRYRFEILKKEMRYEQRLVYHETPKDQVNCPLCYNGFRTCWTLSEQKILLFQQLIQEPALRLRWLGRV